MHIQPVGSPVTTRLDERAPAPVEPAGSVAAVASKSADDTATSASREEVSSAVKKINASMQVSSQSLEFSIDEDSKDIVVKVIDQNTKEVVRQMPSEEALHIAKSLDKMRGLLIRETA
ncbi:flagellar protein FlaG [uncultured Massilia sp.]|uniref:flagellar protein FlaG n=1 Tax=uncultured Massilia sp. TaxID=169973 RepID=UPI0025FD5FBD|nr:flagellar protein FlaG [uncultured Massilia sp.]